MVKIKLAFRPEEQAEDAQEYALQGGTGGSGGGGGEEGRNHLNVQNFGQVNLLESEYEFATAEGPIGGLMVPPVPIHQHDGDDVFQVPFDLEGGLLQGGQNLNDEEGWVEAEDDESEYDDGNGTVGRKKARKAMELKSQQSHDSSIHFGLGGMNVDSSALAAVNMTLDSQGTQPLGRQGAREEEEEEEEWHAFDPEEEEEEEENMGHQDFDITMDTDRDVAGRRTKSSDISDIELVRGDDSRDQMSMVGGGPCAILFVIRYNVLRVCVCGVFKFPLLQITLYVFVSCTLNNRLEGPLPLDQNCPLRSIL